MAYSEQEARRLVVEAGRRLLERGLVARTWGNISARISDTRFVITPSGLGYDTMTPEQLVVVDGRDGSWEGARKPSSERGIHADAYRLRPAADFVIHTHQDMATICGVAGRDLVTGHALLGGQDPMRGLRPALHTETPPGGGGAGGRQPPQQRLSPPEPRGAVPGGRIWRRLSPCRRPWRRSAGSGWPGRCRRRELPVYIPDFGESRRQGDAFVLQLGGAEQVCSLSAPGREPAAALHAALYRSGAAGAVIHLRDPDTVAVSMEGRTLRPLVDDLAQIAGSAVRCVSSYEGAEVLRGLGRRAAVLMQGAGALCVGADREEAAAVAQLLKKGCLARRFGETMPGCRPLGRGDAALQRLIYVTTYARRKNAEE